MHTQKGKGKKRKNAAIRPRALKKAGKEKITVDGIISLASIIPAAKELEYQNFSHMIKFKIGTRQQVEQTMANKVLATMEVRGATNKSITKKQDTKKNNKINHKDNSIKNNHDTDSGNGTSSNITGSVTGSFSSFYCAAASSSSTSSSSSSSSASASSCSSNNESLIQPPPKSGAPYTNGESSIVSYDALSGEEINHLMHGLHPHCTIDGEAVFDQASEKNTISLVENTLTRLKDKYLLSKNDEELWIVGLWITNLEEFYGVLYRISENI
jgi:hypothetical protein